MKKDINIQLLRIFSMLLILSCHFCNEFGNKIGTILGQCFNVGVFIFLFISGYLFGKKDITNVKKWYKKRAIRIFVPLWIWCFVVNIIYLIKDTGDISIKSLIAYLTNLQGFFGGSTGMEHLWFLTLIMLCYIITPFLNKLKNKVSKYNYIIILFILSIASLGVSYLNVKIGRYMFEILLYIFVYYYSYNEDKTKFLNKSFIISVIAIIVAMGLRIISSKFLDNTLIYTNYIVLMTQSIIAVATFSIFKRNKINFNKTSKKIINSLDNNSLYVYIVHYIF